MFKVGDRVKIIPNEYDSLVHLDKTFIIIKIENDWVFLNENYYKDEIGWLYNDYHIHINYLYLDKSYYRKTKILNIYERTRKTNPRMD